jgi:ribosomal protein S18 acetylase RimI-like enzyme
MGACDEMVHLRRARETDARGIAEVHVRTWQEAYRDQLPATFLNALTIDARERYWATELRLMSAERRPWVAESAGQIVGFVAVGGSRGEIAAPQTGEVYAIYVTPDCWKRGVGQMLLAHAERDLLLHGYNQAVLWVLEENQRARAFYEFLGWQADGGTKIDSVGGREVREVRYRIALEKSRVAELL